MTGLLAGEQEIFDCVGECDPTGFDDVGAGADGAPGAFAVGAVDEHAHGGSGGAVAVENAHFVVGEVDLFEAGVVPSATS